MKYLLLSIFFSLTLPLHANEIAPKNALDEGKILREVQLMNDDLSQLKKEITVIHDEFQKGNLQNKKLLSKIKIQNGHILKLSKESVAANFFKDFIYPILLSIVAATIFWLIFSYLPERSRKIRIRTKLDLNIYQIYTRLFSLFDIVMRANNYSPSFFQQQIRGNTLTKIDVELGLQNKCLNETFLFDLKIKESLLPIGKQLHEIIKKIDTNIDRIFNFEQYVSSDEILLLEEIKTKLHTYNLENFSKEAITTIGTENFSPVNPSMSYMADNIIQLYQMHIQLQNIVFSNKLESRDLVINKIQHFIYCDEYEKCIKEINIQIPKYPNEKMFFEQYAFLAEYKQGTKDLAYRRLVKILDNKPHLVSIRSFFSEILTDQKIKETLVNYYSDDELNEFYSVIKKERNQKKIFIETARKLRDYYKNKTTSIKKNSLSIESMIFITKNDDKKSFAINKLSARNRITKTFT